MASNCCILDSIINWQYSCSEIKSYVIIIISIVAPGSQTFTQSNNQSCAIRKPEQTEISWNEVKLSSNQISGIFLSCRGLGWDCGRQPCLSVIFVFAFVFVYVCAFVFVYVRAYLVKGSSETVGGPFLSLPLSWAELRPEVAKNILIHLLRNRRRKESKKR